MRTGQSLGVKAAREKDELLDNTPVDAEETTLIKFTFNDES